MIIVLKTILASGVAINLVTVCELLKNVKFFFISKVRLVSLVINIHLNLIYL
jgi:hypothetical protein